ncbi:hypothetical protein C5167_022114 [Papaver somniferum]|uniref:SP-RING-type domain-containing protein n=1 Tax=Papaver somniferum TaxID=3469 RepID=A0A4Y7JGW5_PAPSO|nr:hypothetical protein C5167_022114 [Papaver somniferum]
MNLDIVLKFPHEEVTLCVCRYSPKAAFTDLKKCQGDKCDSWLHKTCYPRNYCPYCYLDMMDGPFCEHTEALLPPTVLTKSDGKDIGRGTFAIRPVHDLRLKENAHQVQLWCMNLRDNAASGVQWPTECTLTVNNCSLPISPTGSASSHGDCDHDYFFGVSLVKVQSLEQVLEKIVVEPLEVAVNHSVPVPGVEMLTAKVSLTCPFNHSRITHPARFKQCGHLLDLIKFLQYAQASKKLVKWECPVCRKRYSFTDLISDGYLMPILAALPEEVNEIEEVGGEDGVVHIPSDEETQGVASASVAPAYTASTSETKDVNPLDDSLKVLESQYVASTGGGGVVHVSSAEEIRDVAAASVASASVGSTSETRDVRPPDDSLKLLGRQYGGDSDSD